MINENLHLESYNGKNGQELGKLKNYIKNNIDAVSETTNIRNNLIYNKSQPVFLPP